MDKIIGDIWEYICSLLGMPGAIALFITLVILYRVFKQIGKNTSWVALSDAQRTSITQATPFGMLHGAYMKKKNGSIIYIVQGAEKCYAKDLINGRLLEASYSETHFRYARLTFSPGDNTPLLDYPDCRNRDVDKALKTKLEAEWHEAEKSVKS